MKYENNLLIKKFHLNYNILFLGFNMFKYIFTHINFFFFFRNYLHTILNIYLINRFNFYFCGINHTKNKRVLQQRIILIQQHLVYLKP